MRESRASRVAQFQPSQESSSANLQASKFDHEERIIICSTRKNAGDETCSYHENRVTFATHIFPDPIDPNWVAYMRECRERFAFRLFHAIITNNTTSPYVINTNLKIINTLPSVTHWEQFTVWNGLEGKVQTLRIARKREISNRFRTPNIINEKHLLFCCEFPFILDFKFHFQTTGLLCMAVEQLPGGSLQNLVERTGKVPFRQAQFYASQIVLALEYLHAMGIILRDLRLENVVICADGYVKLVDLGKSILMTEGPTKSWYEDYRPGMKAVTARLGFRPPEVWLGERYGPEVDWWSFGLLLYKMYSGNDCFPEEPPSQFYEEHMKRKIFDLHYDTPRWFTAADRKMFKELLMIDPKDRLGSMPAGVLAIKNHSWFRGISWLSIYGGLIPAPEIPTQITGEDPRDNFVKYPEDAEKLSGVKNPFPYGYQFQKF